MYSSRVAVGLPETVSIAIPHFRYMERGVPIIENTNHVNVYSFTSISMHEYAQFNDFVAHVLPVSVFPCDSVE